MGALSAFGGLGLPRLLHFGLGVAAFGRDIGEKDVGQGAHGRGAGKPDLACSV